MTRMGLPVPGPDCAGNSPPGQATGTGTRAYALAGRAAGGFWPSAGKAAVRWRRSAGSGFTVIELLIVMMAVSIVVVMGLPPMFATVRGTRLESARQELIGDLRLARMEAIRRNVSIAVVKTGATTYAIDSLGTRTLAGGVRFTSGPTTLRFAPIGRVTTGQASYTLHLDGRNAVVHVNTAGNATAK